MMVGSARFRASSCYELVGLERLLPAERQLLDDTASGKDLYGVLRPRPGAQYALREASADVALLFLSLSEPGPLPSYVVRRLGDELDNSIAKLVLDGVLELERDGSFVSGVDAAEALSAGTEAGQGRIAQLSVAALRYCQALDVPIEVLALRLYLYGRWPVSPAWKRRLGSEGALDAFLGLPYAAGGWTEIPAEATAPWRMWRPRGRMELGERSAGYKLYVSAALDALPDALPAVAEALAPVRGASGFKMARDVHGLCRPDKLVAYFTRLDDLREAAAELRERLAGCRAQGVPFTAEITADGLLSWGVDPPPDRELRAAAEPNSWRFWIVRRLAAYVADARVHDPSAQEPWLFALERLRLDGVDTDTWIPGSRIWHREAAVA
jgi:hypothetical protein